MKLALRIIAPAFVLLAALWLAQWHVDFFSANGPDARQISIGEAAHLYFAGACGPRSHVHTYADSSTIEAVCEL